MSKPVKVFNRGTRPVVFKRDLTGTDAIQPGKFLWFNPGKAEKIKKKFKDACSEDDYKKRLIEIIKEREAASKELEKSKGKK